MDTQTNRCLRCNTSQQTDIKLDCQHTLCLVCLCFIVMKAESKQLPFPTSIECPLCKQKTKLKETYVDIIKMTIENVVVPKFHDTLTYSPEQSRTYTLQKSIDELSQSSSRQNCSHQKLTGVTTMNQSANISLPTKSFGSSCSSPKLVKGEACNLHSSEEYMFSCNDCGNQFLCLKCYNDGKHKTHDVRSIKSTVALCVQQLSINKYQISERKQLLELMERKIRNRKELLKNRLTLSRQKIQKTFQDLIQRLNNKKIEVISELESYFYKIEEQMDTKLSEVQNQIQISTMLFQKVNQISNNESPLSYIRTCLKLQQQLSKKQQFNSALQILTITSSSNKIFEVSQKNVVDICKIINQMSFQEQKQTQLRLNKSAKNFRIQTDPSFRNKSKQKSFKTQKTDWGQRQFLKQSGYKSRNTCNSPSSKNPLNISYLLSRQLSCQNLYKQKQEVSMNCNNISQSFVSNHKVDFSRRVSSSKQRKQRKTTGGMSVNRNDNINEKGLLRQKQRVQKSVFQKKLKKVINKNK